MSDYLLPGDPDSQAFSTANEVLMLQWDDMKKVSS